MYVSLFHGRKDPQEIMEHWGVEGPTFGPYQYVQVTYGQHIKMGRPDKHIDDLFWSDDFLIYYDGTYYGDMSVFMHNEPLANEHLREFDQSLVSMPSTIWVCDVAVELGPNITKGLKTKCSPESPGRRQSAQETKQPAEPNRGSTHIVGPIGRSVTASRDVVKM